MNFFLNTPITKSAVNISHQDAILLLGSCFTENIGKKLLNSKFKVNINPFGIIYNPISIANSLTRILNNESYTEEDLSVYNGKFFCFDHHGSFSSFNQQECLAKINNEISFAHQHLQETKTIIITLGTAWVYENIENKKLVANCHKIPAKNFTKRLLSVDEIVQSFSALANTLKNIQFIFTVSPVRHISDGLHENNISKSVLHLAIHQLTSQHKNCSYFAAYEMVIDELRDYRFFKEDMIHPTPQAINYVWEKFATTYFNKETTLLNQQIEKLQQAALHRPFNFESEAHQKFIKEQVLQMQQLENEFPFLSFDEEISLLKHNFI
ncbi:MAG: GSCFA domain-containing protein [Flavobacteriales bacterium]|nr:MAG: GSCFA domain-containing protein [Flavobacteriales bacterium]